MNMVFYDRLKELSEETILNFLRSIKKSCDSFEGDYKDFYYSDEFQEAIKESSTECRVEFVKEYNNLTENTDVPEIDIASLRLSRELSVTTDEVDNIISEFDMPWYISAYAIASGIGYEWGYYRDAASEEYPLPIVEQDVISIVSSMNREILKTVCVDDIKKISQTVGAYVQCAYLYESTRFEKKYCGRFTPTALELFSSFDDCFYNYTKAKRADLIEMYGSELDFESLCDSINTQLTTIKPNWEDNV